MKFVLQSLTITNSLEWFEIDGKVNGIYREASALCSVMNNTGGLEIYYVQTIEGGSVVFSTQSGIVIESPGSAHVLAHEIGHACGMKDIYPYHRDTSIIVQGSATKTRAPLDWSCKENESYYTPDISQQILMKRLVMCGDRFQGNADISLGNLYGLYYRRAVSNPNDRWYLDMIPVGFSENATRSPRHR